MESMAWRKASMGPGKQPKTHAPNDSDAVFRQLVVK